MGFGCIQREPYINQLRMASEAPRICTVYLQDMFQFATRPWIDRNLGMASRHFNTAISTTGEIRLPKRLCKMLVQVGLTRTPTDAN